LGGAIVSDSMIRNWMSAPTRFWRAVAQSYARDSNHYYYNGIPLDKTPASSLIVLSDDYAKDAQRAYYQFNVIAEPIQAHLLLFKEPDSMLKTKRIITFLGRWFSRNMISLFLQTQTDASRLIIREMERSKAHPLPRRVSMWPDDGACFSKEVKVGNV